MIISFADSKTQKLWNRQLVPKIDSRIQKTALRKLRMLDAAYSLEDVKVPPGNRLELLKGNRAGQYSIRVNDQWRICFNWTQGGATNVELIDYH